MTPIIGLVGGPYDGSIFVIEDFEMVQYQGLRMMGSPEQIIAFSTAMVNKRRALLDQIFMPGLS